MPLSGGIIGINILTGMSSYEKGDAPENYYGIDAKEHEASMKSFTVFKVDNIDFAASDLRIVDSNGDVSHEGRVEIRNNGLWGTICAHHMNSYAARVICR
jgi:hypothetical protein